MLFQGRGTTYAAERGANGTVGASVAICQDAFAVSLTTESFEHINKCAAVDVPDYRGTKSVSGELTLSFADVADKKFAIGVLGTLTAAAVGTSSVTAEVGAQCDVGEVYFLGGIERHRNITALTITDAGSPGGALVADTDYTLDAVSGKVTFLTATDGTISCDYTHQDPASVSMLSAGQPEYSINFEGINKANANAKGSVELYRVRFDPAQNVDFLSDELQIMELKGTVLADSEKAADDTEFGQFGRRIGFA